MFAVLPKVYCMSIAFPSARMETGRLRLLDAHYLASFGVKQVQNNEILRLLHLHGKNLSIVKAVYFCYTVFLLSLLPYLNLVPSLSSCFSRHLP